MEKGPLPRRDAEEDGIQKATARLRKRFG